MVLSQVTTLPKSVELWLRTTLTIAHRIDASFIIVHHSLTHRHRIARCHHITSHWLSHIVISSRIIIASHYVIAFIIIYYLLCIALCIALHHHILTNALPNDIASSSLVIDYRHRYPLCPTPMPYAHHPLTIRHHRHRLLCCVSQVPRVLYGY